MSKLFSELEKERLMQRDAIQDTTPSQDQPHEPVQVQPTQKVTQISNRLSKPLSKSLSKPSSQRLTTEMIENLAFQLRKQPKFRVNADIPQEWKDQLDDMAHKLRVGKYELLTYIIGLFLGEIGENEKP